MKKTLSAISMILAAVMIIASASVAAFADAPESDSPVYTKREVPAFVFKEDCVTSLECLFRSDLPDVVYVDPVDYLNVIFIEPFAGEEKEDGTFGINNPYGYTMTVDAENDSVFFDYYNLFYSCEINEEGSSISIDYFETVNSYYAQIPYGLTLDLGAYGIDVAALDGKVYMPLTVISAMFSITYNNALYFDGSICFVHSLDDESYYEYLDLSPLYEDLTRTPGMARFTYDTLCFMIDNFYGKPRNTRVAGMLDEKGFDRTLDEFDDRTPLVKELLLSENRTDYLSGLYLLGYYLFDGGHTVFASAVTAGRDTPLYREWKEKFASDPLLSSLISEAENDLLRTGRFLINLKATRNVEYISEHADEIVRKWESGSYLMVRGDTAVFVFDSFEQDTPYEFKEALDIAAEKGAKNFLLDDSCNGGGLVLAMQYIVTLITNGKTDTPNLFSAASYETVSDTVTVYDYKFDLDLDGDVDEDDDAVRYDFNYGILTSRYSFSCGNAMPIIAQYLGNVAILGERSGGGSCFITQRYLADSLAFYISDIGKFALYDDEEGVLDTFDLGAAVDYDLRKPVEQGGFDGYDFSGFYDIDRIGALLEAYYSPAAGDANRDGGINARDVIAIMRYCAGWDDALFSAEAADFNGDGKVNNLDVLLMMKAIANGELG